MPVSEPKADQYIMVGDVRVHASHGFGPKNNRADCCLCRLHPEQCQRPCKHARPEQSASTGSGISRRV